MVSRDLVPMLQRIAGPRWTGKPLQIAVDDVKDNEGEKACRAVGDQSSGARDDAGRSQRDGSQRFTTAITPIFALIGLVFEPLQPCIQELLDEFVARGH